MPARRRTSRRVRPNSRRRTSRRLRANAPAHEPFRLGAREYAKLSDKLVRLTIKELNLGEPDMEGWDAARADALVALLAESYLGAHPSPINGLQTRQDAMFWGREIADRLGYFSYDF